MSHPESAEAHGQHFRIFVNGREETVDRKVLSYETVVAIAFPTPSPDDLYTVTYKKAVGSKTEGTLLPGGEVKIHTGTIFNVTATRKS